MKFWLNFYYSLAYLILEGWGGWKIVCWMSAVQLKEEEKFNCLLMALVICFRFFFLQQGKFSCGFHEGQQLEIFYPSSFFSVWHKILKKNLQISHKSSQHAYSTHPSNKN